MKTRKIHSHINFQKYLFHHSVLISNQTFIENIRSLLNVQSEYHVELPPCLTSISYIPEHGFSQTRIFSYKNRICEFRIGRHEYLFHSRGLKKLITELYINSNFPAVPCLQENPIFSIKM